MSFRYAMLAAVAATALAAQASAQTPAAQPAQPNPLAQALQAAQASPRGPVVPGLCVVSRQQVLGTSQVGRYAAQQLQQIQNQVNTELTTAQQAAETEARNLQAQRATSGDQAFATAVNGLNQRLEQLLSVRSQEVQVTSQQVEQKLNEELTPVIIDAFNARNCSVLLDSDAVLMRGDSYDISNDVVTRLNARITSFPIQRAVAPNQPPPVVGAAPATNQPATIAPPAQGPRR